MSALPKAAAQAAAVTACARAVVLQADVVHSVLMRFPSSLVTVEAAGELASCPLPSTLAASALVIWLVDAGYVDAPMVTEGNSAAL